MAKSNPAMLLKAPLSLEWDLPDFSLEFDGPSWLLSDEESAGWAGDARLNGMG
jgi:hypothetical protein